MSVRKGRLGLPFQGKGRQVRDDLGELLCQEIQSILHEDQFSVVSDVAAGRAVVNNTSGSRSDLAEGVNMLDEPVSGRRDVLISNFLPP